MKKYVAVHLDVLSNAQEVRVQIISAYTGSLVIVYFILIEYQKR